MGVPFVPASGTVATLSVAVAALLTLAGVTASRRRDVAGEALRVAFCVTLLVIAVSAVHADTAGVLIMLCLVGGIMRWLGDIETSP